MLLPTAGNVLLHDRRFDKLFGYFEESGLPVCVHVGWSHDGIRESCDFPAASFILNFEMSMVMGFFSFLGGGILDRFPNLEVAFLEGGIGWYPQRRCRAWSTGRQHLPQNLGKRKRQQANI